MNTATMSSGSRAKETPLTCARPFTSFADPTVAKTTKKDRRESVVVGVDGSRAALEATAWAVAEAVSLGLPLRLVHVRVARGPAARADGFGDDTIPAESALYRAEMVVHDMATPVRVETAIVEGNPACVLIGESRMAALVCVGSAGKGPCTRMPLGSTAAALAKHANCPVAIVRCGAAPPTDTGWVAAVQNDEPDNDAVIHWAMQEGRLRRAPVLLIDTRRDSWIRRYPDVVVRTVATRDARTRSNVGDSDSIQLAVVGLADADHIAELVWHDYHPLLGDAGRSVLLVRN
ncbi:universal stress protein [Mycolicibacterium sp.]|uniref:universal stress protein n=1 Tax=Mycolicibacterium sp. TaxID=2320850 RepID=UPI0037CB2A52